MEDDLVIVHAFGSLPEADLAKSALDAAGIEAMVRADSGGGMRPALAWSGVGYQVLVRAEDEQAARDILDLPARPTPGVGMSEKRVTDYDTIADDYDARYRLYEYGGVRETLLGFLGDPAPLAMLEVGCGTGHWLAEVGARLTPSPYKDGDAPSPSIETCSAKASAERRLLAGVDPSAPMLARARLAAPAAPLVRARAEDLPWQRRSFDRSSASTRCIHFADRARFFEEARRRPQAGRRAADDRQGSARRPGHVVGLRLLHGNAAPSTGRYARVRTLRGEMAHAGFAWADSLEGRPYRSGAEPGRRATERHDRAVVHLAADGAVQRRIQSGAGAIARRRRGRRRRAPARDRFQALCDGRVGVSVRLSRNGPAEAGRYVRESCALMYSRVMRAMFEIGISFGHTASHSPSFEQLPNPSLSACAIIAVTRP
jgi:SAM-dependent methyltransferase